MAISSMKDNERDGNLRKLLESKKSNIKIIGVGGAGGNTISRLHQIGVDNATTIAVNTDAQDLLHCTSDDKILVGKETSKGLGAGANPNVGEESAKENKNDIKNTIDGADMIFITCGLGGGTGTGASPVIAEMAKKIGALTVAIVTLPFTMESTTRMNNAKKGLDKLKSIVDTLIVIPNDKLLDVVPNVSLPTAFKVADEILVNAVKGITDLVTKPGLVNLDFADIKTVMTDGGIAMIGMGESDSENRAEEAIDKAVNNPLLDIDIDGAQGALINITGGTDITIKECQKIVENITERLNPEAKIIWGAQILKELGESIRAMIIITGVNAPHVYGIKNTYKEERKKEIEKTLGIEFIE